MSDVDVLARALAEVGTAIEVPEHSLWPRVHAHLPLDVDRRRAPRCRPALILAAAVVLVVLVLTVAIAPARRAVADFLGIGATTVVRTDQPPADGLPGARDDLPTTADVQVLEAAIARAGLQLPARKLVGTPTAWTVDPDETVVAYDRVVFGQRMADGVPAVKRVPLTGRVESTTVDGVPALWIEGPHTRLVRGREYRSDSALVWTSDGIEFRLEGDLARSEMRRIAASVKPVPV